VFEGEGERKKGRKGGRGREKMTVRTTMPPAYPAPSPVG
jgi:hypothetical protein